MADMPNISSPQDQSVFTTHHAKEQAAELKANPLVGDLEQKQATEKVRQEQSTQRAEEWARKQEEFESLISEVVNRIVDEQSPSNGDILNRIIRLITELLPVFQRIGAAQAEQMGLSTKMQTLYTELIAKAPYYDYNQTKGRWDSNEDKNEKIRTDLNTKAANQTDIYRAYRDEWGERGKKDQSYVNTTNEAINQQTDMATTMLQQLRELVSALTR
jgi:hypothetical protein